MSKSTPIPSKGIIISANNIAASTPNISTGCNETFAASSGFLTISKIVYFSLSFLYSGKYLPACRIYQTGVYDVFFRKQASRKVVFIEMKENQIKIYRCR